MAEVSLPPSEWQPLAMGHNASFPHHISSSLKSRYEGRAAPSNEPETHSSLVNNTSQISSRILDIICKYRLEKAEDAHDKWLEGTPRFLQLIENFVAKDVTVRMCLPAFPFKSANKIYKVLGSLPDKAEEMSLARLNTMCAEIGEIYSPGAKLTIISDGLVYNGV